MEEPEPLDEWPREKTEAVGEDKWVEDVEERETGVMASVGVEYEDSMSGWWFLVWFGLVWFWCWLWLWIMEYYS